MLPFSARSLVAARRVLACLLVSPLLASSLSACGDDDHPPPPPTDMMIRFDSGDGGTIEVDANIDDGGPPPDFGRALGDCRRLGDVALLDTSTSARTEGVAVTASGATFALAFPAFRADGTNVVVRSMALDGTLGAEALASGTFLTTRNPDLAPTATGELAIFETNDSGRFQLATRRFIGGAAQTLMATSLTTSTLDVPAGPALAALTSGLVGAWLTHADDGVGTRGPERVVLALFDASGALVGTPSELATAAPTRALTLARSLDGTSALVTIESAVPETATIRLRTIDGAGLVAATVVEVATARAVTSVAAVRTDDGVLVAWGETIGGIRQDVRLLLVHPDGSLGDERFATLGPETGAAPALAAGVSGVLLAYRGGQGLMRGVRAVPVDTSGMPSGTVATIIETTDDDGDLAIATNGAAGLAVIVSDRSGSSGRVQAAIADCGAI